MYIKSRNNTNHLIPLYESEDEGSTKYRTKSKTPIIVLSEEEKGRKDKVDQIMGNKEDEDNT